MLLTIVTAFFLDYKLGESRTLCHPVQVIGGLISLLEKYLKKDKLEKTAGGVLLVIVIAMTWLVTWYLVNLSWALELLLAYTVLAARSLADEASVVHDTLKSGSLQNARKQIAMLVSRDTADMKRADVIRATVETVSENIVDGVIAPLFYLFIGGVPLAMAYKAVNTLDSMVGYKNERYLRYGWASAKCDDVLNYIPARLAAFIIIPCASFLCGHNGVNALRIVKRDRFNHSSPNSGHPEAAVAGALGCRLGGPTSYFGVVSPKPYIGDAMRPLRADDIRHAIRLMYCSSVLGLLIGIVVYFAVVLIWMNI